jgi:hypothetical protein
MTRPSVLAALGSALMIGLAGFTSLYIMVFALLTIGPIFLFLLLENRRWSRSNIRPVVVAFVVTSAFLLGIRLVPILRDTGDLTEAIVLKYSASQNQTDLLSYILPPPLNPLFGPFTGEIADNLTNMSSKWPAYLGIVSLALTIAALTWKKRRKITLLWLSIGLLFVILSLGPALRLNGILHESIVLPARLLSWFPPIRAVGRPDFFVMGVLLPLAMLASYGFDRLLLALADRRKIQIIMKVLIPVLIMIEYWNGEFPGVSAEVSPFYEQLSDKKDDLAIIDLPMGRPESKRYLYLQTIHQKPIVEGLSARTPEEAYHYILKNPLLLNWSHATPLNCGILPLEVLMSALDELVEADFGYVVIHHKESTVPFEFASYFSATPIYQDSTLTAYKLVDLLDQPFCTSAYSRVYDLPSPDISASVGWDQKLSLLGYDLPIIDREANVVTVTVYWQALKDMEKSYTAYFHLTDPETDTIVAQADVIPRGWSYPTDWWVRDEVVDDIVQIPIENVPAGRYELRIGWYDQGTGNRLTAVSDQLQVTSDGSVILTEIED